MAINTKYIWMNGEFVLRDKAVSPFLSNALHYGIGFLKGSAVMRPQMAPRSFA